MKYFIYVLQARSIDDLIELASNSFRLKEMNLMLCKQD